MNAILAKNIGKNGKMKYQINAISNSISLYSLQYIHEFMLCMKIDAEIKTKD